MAQVAKTNPGPRRRPEVSPVTQSRHYGRKINSRNSRHHRQKLPKLGIFMFNLIQKNYNKFVTTCMCTCIILLPATVADTYTEQCADHSGNDIEFNKFKGREENDPISSSTRKKRKEMSPVRLTEKLWLKVLFADLL
jgi:hypothetical protein